jgi:hypothetical protein
VICASCGQENPEGFSSAAAAAHLSPRGRGARQLGVRLAHRRSSGNAWREHARQQDEKETIQAKDSTEEARDTVERVLGVRLSHVLNVAVVFAVMRSRFCLKACPFGSLRRRSLTRVTECEPDVRPSLGRANRLPEPNNALPASKTHRLDVTRREEVALLPWATRAMFKSLTPWPMR